MSRGRLVPGKDKFAPSSRSSLAPFPSGADASRMGCQKLSFGDGDVLVLGARQSRGAPPLPVPAARYTCVGARSCFRGVGEYSQLSWGL